MNGKLNEKTINKIRYEIATQREELQPVTEGKSEIQRKQIKNIDKP